MIKKITFILSILIFSYSFSQKNYSSIYSRYGIGELAPKGYGNNIAMGFTGIAYRDKNYLNEKNVASYTAFDTMTVIFNFGVNGKYSNVVSPNVNESHYYANISNISIGFPITKWYYAGVGMRPYSSTNYSITNITELNDSEDNLITETTQNYTGEGNINQFYISQAFKLTKKLSIGAHISYLYGNIVNTTTLTFPSSFGANNMFKENKTYINDFYFDFAAQYYTKLSDDYKITLGVTYDMQKNIASQTSTTVQSYKGSSSTYNDTLEIGNTAKNNLTLPMAIGGGIGIQYKKRYNFMVDYSFTNWKSAQFFEEVEVNNSSKINVGLEILPQSNSLKYMNLIRYRIGGYYKKSYVIVDNNQIQDFGITFGFGMPIRKTGTSFNFAFVLGRMGVPNNTLVTENYAGFNLSISFMDKWFYQRKFD